MAEINHFDPNAQQPAEIFEPLPAGWYAMRITEDEVRPTKDDPTRAYLWMKLEIDENYHPELHGRAAFERLNLWNPNEKTVAIARRSLTSICRAVGQMGAFTDTTVLKGKTMAVKLVVRHDEGYEPSNEVRGYDAVTARVTPGGRPPATSAPARPVTVPVTQGSAPRPPAQASAAPPGQVPPTGGQAPWKR